MPGPTSASSNGIIRGFASGSISAARLSGSVSKYPQEPMSSTPSARSSRFRSKKKFVMLSSGVSSSTSRSIHLARAFGSFLRKTAVALASAAGATASGTAT